MSHQDIINAWKSDPEDRNTNVPTSPVGEELTDDELATIQGGDSNCSGCSNCGRSFDPISVFSQPNERIFSIRTFASNQIFSK
jgi:mersacidin/lichenicidin family type 2 lantibiotic